MATLIKVDGTKIVNKYNYKRVMKKKTAKRINVAGWFALAIILMRCAYSAWSQNGPYTMGSFCASLVFYGGACFLGWLGVQECINKHYSNK